MRSSAVRGWGGGGGWMNGYQVSFLVKHCVTDHDNATNSTWILISKTAYHIPVVF